jgi:hypothetical protein
MPELREVNRGTSQRGYTFREEVTDHHEPTILNLSLPLGARIVNSLPFRSAS